MRRNSRQHWRWSRLIRSSGLDFEHCWTPTAVRVTMSTCLWLRTGCSYRCRERTHLFRSQHTRSTSYVPRSLTRTRDNDPNRRLSARSLATVDHRALRDRWLGSRVTRRSMTQSTLFSSIRTLAETTKFWGANRGANRDRHRATPSGQSATIIAARWLAERR